jgi:hypothetical protein
VRGTASGRWESWAAAMMFSRFSAALRRSGLAAAVISFGFVADDRGRGHHCGLSVLHSGLFDLVGVALGG